MKKLMVAITLLIVLAGCGGEEVSPPQAQSVVTAVAARASLPEHLTLTGTLTPDQATTISAKIPGKISYLAAEVGARIPAGAPLAQLESSTQDTALRAIERNLANAKQGIQTLTALFDERITNAQKTLTTTRETGHRSIAVLETQLKATRSDIGRSGDTTLTNTSIILEQTVDALDRILGVSPKYEPLNDAFENYLGALDTSAQTTAEAALRDLIQAHGTYRADFNTYILNRTPSTYEREENTKLAINALEAAKTALEKTYTLLIKSVTAADFTATQLDSYKTSVTTLGGQVEQLLHTAKTLRDSSTDESETAVIERQIDKARSDIAAQIEQIELSIQTLEREKAAKLSEATTLVTRLEGEASMSGLSLADTTVTAPLGGIVTKKLVEVGQVVGPGTPIFEITDDSQMKLIIGIPDTAVGALPIGREATVTVDSVSGTFAGRISKIDPSADPLSKKVNVEIRLPNTSAKLKAGMFARVAFALASVEGVIVPSETIVSRYGEHFVYVMKDNKAEQRIVTIGSRTDSSVALTSGIAEGETVIVKGNTYLRDGDSVSITATPSTSFAQE